MASCESAVSSRAAPMLSFSIDAVIRGHHVYKSIWTPFVGEQLVLQRDERNKYDRYAVAVKKEKKIVGHVPKELSKKCSDFLKSGGVIGCEVTGKRRKGKGLEVPCKYTFCGT